MRQTISPLALPATKPRNPPARCAGDANARPCPCTAPEPTAGPVDAGPGDPP